MSKVRSRIAASTVSLIHGRQTPTHIGIGPVDTRTVRNTLVTIQRGRNVMPVVITREA